jgi:hypothetical protein
VVVDALRQQLQDPRLLAEYVSAYREERRALADRAIRDRSRIERKLANATATLNRTIGAYVKGAMTVEELESRRVEMDAEVARWEAELAKAELAKAEPVPAIELHPQAVEQHRRDIEDFYAALARAAVEGDGQIAGPLRAGGGSRGRRYARRGPGRGRDQGEACGSDGGADRPKRARG